jgi:hypothetical protein
MWNEFERFDSGGFDLYPNKFARMTIDIGVGDESPSCNLALGDFSMTRGPLTILVLGHSNPNNYPVPQATSGFAASYDNISGDPIGNNGYKEYTYYMAGETLGGAIKSYFWNLSLIQNPVGCDPYNGNASMSVVCYDYPVIANSNADFFNVTSQFQTETRSFEVISGAQFCKLRLHSDGVIVGSTGFSWAKLSYTLLKNGVVFEQSSFEVSGPYGGFGSVDTKEREIILDTANGDEGVYQITIQLEMTTHPQNPPAYANGSFELFTPAPTLN